MNVSFTMFVTDIFCLNYWISLMKRSVARLPLVGLIRSVVLNWIIATLDHTASFEFYRSLHALLFFTLQISI